MAMNVNAVVGARPVHVGPADADAELVAAARANPREFLALYERYFDRVLGYARLRVRDPATCEDVTSRVFTTALAQLHRFRGDGSFAGWLFQIARNAVHDVQRERTAVPFTEERADAGPTPEERVLERERAQELHTLIRLLRPDQQHLLALRYGAGLPYEEIGAIVGGAPATVRVRMHRILEELRLRYSHDDA
jgi:RNA polymerase sigma-70 factor (ECF subfamily)